MLSGVGPFAAAVRLSKKWKNPVLVSSTDGVGTKLALARILDRHDTIGIDLVAMNANDLVTCGATPSFFLDYLAVGRLASVDGETIIRGIADGCRQAGMSLVGGETAEMPGFYRDGEYDLAGFCVGIAERRRMIDGSAIRPGDALIGLESSGLHSNGYSLARKVLRTDDRRLLRKVVPELGESLADALLRPTRIYVRSVLALGSRFSIRGMAHITGGGIPGNLVRVLPADVRAVVRREAIEMPPIFELLQRRGRIERREMDRTFNCGIGYVIVVRPTDADAVCRTLRRRGVACRPIGEVQRGRRAVIYR